MNHIEQTLGAPRYEIHDQIQYHCGFSSAYAKTIANTIVDEVMLDMVESGCGKDFNFDDVRLAVDRALLKALGKEV